MTYFSWIILRIVNIRFFSKQKYKNTLWVIQTISNDSKKPDIYINIMRIVSLIKTDDAKWKNEALWLIKRNKFGNVSDDEREYLTQYLNQQSNGQLEKHCTHEDIEFDNVSNWVKKNFPLG